MWPSARRFRDSPNFQGPALAHSPAHGSIRLGNGCRTTRAESIVCQPEGWYMIYCTPAANPLSPHTDCRFSPPRPSPKRRGCLLRIARHDPMGTDCQADLPDLRKPHDPRENSQEVLRAAGVPSLRMSALRGLGNGRRRPERGLFCTLITGTSERPSVLLVTCGMGVFHSP
jgi:hypothetical protein